MTYIHQLIDVHSKNLGDYSRIWQYFVALREPSIDDNCNVSAHTFIENAFIIENNVTIKCGVYLWDRKAIDNNVHLGPNITFTNDKYSRTKQPFELKRTIL